jgi:hypothetical protein
MDARLNQLSVSVRCESCPKDPSGIWARHVRYIDEIDRAGRARTRKTQRRSFRGSDLKVEVSFLVNFSGDIVSHSQIVRTAHPAWRNRTTFRRSRFTFCRNFVAQNSALVLGVVVFEHLSCRCQKQPCTKRAVRYLGITKSGVPGRSLRWRRNRKPSACNERRTVISGFVFVRPTARIILVRIGSTDIRVS